MEPLDLWRAGDVRHRTNYQEKHCLRHRTTRRLDAREQVDDYADLHDANGPNDRCVKARLNAWKVGPEFRWGAIALDLRDSDPAAVHYRRPGHARSLPRVLDQLSRTQY